MASVAQTVPTVFARPPGSIVKRAASMLCKFSRQEKVTGVRQVSSWFEKLVVRWNHARQLASIRR